MIFYGDTNPQKDWFVLGLRDGRPEIQMRNHLAQLTVGAGPRLDDGKWHQVSQVRACAGLRKGNRTGSPGNPLPPSSYLTRDETAMELRFLSPIFSEGNLRLRS